MDEREVRLIGVPMDCGKRQQGCRMGPDAYRVAGINAALRSLKCRVTDEGDVQPSEESAAGPTDVFAGPEVIAWTKTLAEVSAAAMGRGLPVFMGGDHALSLGTVSGAAAQAAKEQRPLYLLWLDAHADYHSPETTQSGNLHGTPVAYFAGVEGFPGFPPVQNPIPHGQIAMLGLRSVDPAERAALQETAVHYIDMRQIDEGGIAGPLAKFLDRVADAGGLLHVSLDVDFLDPSVAPAVVTTVPGGATIREAHLVMEMVSDSGLLASLDLVELNPFLDERGRTAQLMVDLAASALGRRVFDRPTRAYT